ncbi:thiamine pyrophosphate-dependent dehydrogenase E1 component subunit alpha [Butyrivibrio sp. YAB3001]|uniref:thiamine pyrophosphate-dependent dehydrogenase E1 component subunit alpha n=1 Tax=Butyrivibrio sp. YAB3001 TaxID=1520812 RepID=UPI001587FABD|nr:thiamine pyrophosphate-dependent dehydrogenase E1 component subunit alpha [Butyrivibrio sp. YAB3001]
MKIRLFEKRIEDEFSLGKMRGTTHGCIGQEIIPVFVMEQINRDTDYITGTHRCHGQVLAYTDDMYSLACEMMGKQDGFVNGLGGSQHIKIGNYITNGITGGMITVASGIAMGKKKNCDSGIVIAFAGDGGFNEGYVQESLNLASNYELPLLIICENNGYAMSTPTQEYSAGSFKARVEALNIRYIETTSTLPDVLEQDIIKGFSYVRNEEKPCFIDVHTARLCGHSKSDSMEYMSDEEKENNMKSDPILWLAKKIDSNEVEMINERIAKEVDDAFLNATNCREITLD